jgi:hypothetical protein
MRQRTATLSRSSHSSQTTSFLSTMKPMTMTIGGFSILDHHFNCSSELSITERFSSVTSRSAQCSVGLEFHTQCTISASSKLVSLAFQEARQVIVASMDESSNFLRISFVILLSCRYHPYVWVGTEALVAWATMEDFPDRSFDELMTAKNYLDKELIHLPTSPKFWQFFPDTSRLHRRSFWSLCEHCMVSGRFGYGLGRERRNLSICLMMSVINTLTQS